MERFQEIERRLRDGRSLREIARALGCSRKTVREVRDGLRLSPATPLAVADPLWMSQVDWSAVVHELGLGHPLKFIWEERAQSLTGYPKIGGHASARRAARASGSSSRALSSVFQ